MASRPSLAVSTSRPSCSKASQATSRFTGLSSASRNLTAWLTGFGGRRRRRCRAVRHCDTAARITRCLDLVADDVRQAIEKGRLPQRTQQDPAVRREALLLDLLFAE